jgi:hypothetical protein
MPNFSKSGKKTSEKALLFPLLAFFPHLLLLFSSPSPAPYSTKLPTMAAAVPAFGDLAKSTKGTCERRECAPSGSPSRGGKKEKENIVEKEEALNSPSCCFFFFI